MLSTLPALDNPPSISAEELHSILLRAHASGNAARKRFCDALRALHESRFYFHLGFPDVAAYADATFHLSRSQTYELLRVSNALLELPRISAAFEQGEVSWSLVLGLSRVADASSEAEWLELLKDRPVRAVFHELKDAQRKGRTRPRRDGFGLPGLPVRVAFELSPEDHAVVAAAFKRVAQEMEESLEGSLPGPREALLYLCHRVLETEPGEKVTTGRKEREDSPFAVVFHRCPDCRRASVESEVGRVEVTDEAIDRIEASAEIVVPLEERDRPNTPAIRRAVRLREGGRCANPFCRRETGAEGHAHHVQFRSKGGRTELSNEAGLCVQCHAFVHAGGLNVESDGSGGLRFRRVSSSSTHSARESIEVQGESTQLASIAARGPAIDVEIASTVLQALIQLGWTHREAEGLRERARESLARTLSAGESPDESRWLREACRVG